MTKMSRRRQEKEAHGEFDGAMQEVMRGEPMVKQSAHFLFAGSSMRFFRIFWKSFCFRSSWAF